jgi:two-component system response regulator PilR (NtrC family)
MSFPQVTAQMTHILVVDDEPDILRILSAILGRYPKVRVSTARRASVARAVLMSEPVDLLITDARMPGENGVALAQAAAELGIPTIIMTGDNEWAIAQGAHPVCLLEKPFEAATVQARVARLLGDRLLQRSKSRSDASPQASTDRIDRAR